MIGRHKTPFEVRHPFGGPIVESTEEENNKYLRYLIVESEKQKEATDILLSIAANDLAEKQRKANIEAAVAMYTTAKAEEQEEAARMRSYHQQQQEWDRQDRQKIQTMSESEKIKTAKGCLIQSEEARIEYVSSGHTYRRSGSGYRRIENSFALRTAQDYKEKARKYVELETFDDLRNQLRAEYNKRFNLEDTSDFNFKEKVKFVFKHGLRKYEMLNKAQRHLG